jgi:hypothetical protein
MPRIPPKFYDLTIQIFNGLTGSDKGKSEVGDNTSGGTGAGPGYQHIPSQQGTQRGEHRPFDMHGIHRPSTDRFTSFDTSRNNSIGIDTSPSRQSVSSMTGSTSIQPVSSDSSPNIATPESLRQFDPDNILGNLNMTSNGIDATVNVREGLSDEGGAGFFTEMLGVQFNGH